jgi:type II secretory ATPase GspE/PulE/Tfp pilus assembly ATPase PilB-like protein
MSDSLVQQVQRMLDAVDDASERYATLVVEQLLQTAAALGASDLHLQPTQQGLDLKWRMDGVLHTAGVVPLSKAGNVLARLKVLAGLLTYRTETPQEGRLPDAKLGLEFRVSTFPTLYGEKAVVRLLTTGSSTFERLDQLGFHRDLQKRLRAAATCTSGALLLVGPAGSGKTTTAYTLLREIIRATCGGRSIASLEDPIEAAIEGVAQSQINQASGFDLLTALRSLVRQDPEVIFVGEMRDAEVAKVAYQAAMTGQLVISTFHATGAADALARLLDMGIPPYVVRGATRLVVAQRLLRKSCASCPPAAGNPAGLGTRGDTPQMNDSASRSDPPRACATCRGTRYAGRLPVAEAMDLETAEIATAILRRADANRLRALFAAAGYASLLDQARSLASDFRTTEGELVRVFGLTAITEHDDVDEYPDAKRPDCS